MVGPLLDRLHMTGADHYLERTKSFTREGFISGIDILDAPIRAETPTTTLIFTDVPTNSKDTIRPLRERLMIPDLILTPLTLLLRRLALGRTGSDVLAIKALILLNDLILHGTK
jgi:hypothetical protein